MAYATQAQIELAAGGPARLLQIADWDDDGDVDADVIAWAQLTADSLINAHAQMRFAALLDADDATVDFAVMLAANEAVYQLRSNRGQASDKDVADAAARLDLYKAIAAGTIRPAEPAPTKSTAVTAEWLDREDDADGDGFDEAVSRSTLRGLW